MILLLNICRSARRPSESRFGTFIFDALGRQTQEIDALNKAITYTYNAIDQLTQKKDRKNQTIDYSYDSIGRLAGEVWKNSGGTTTNTQTFTYDSANRLLTASDANGTYTFTYDAIGEVLTQKDMWNTTLTFTYDNVGNRTKVQDSFSGVETSVYDAANNLTSRKIGGIGGTSQRLDFTYTAINQMENIKRYNASSGGSMTSQTTYTFDSVGSTTGIKNADGSGTVLSQYTYTYDAGNRLSTETLAGMTKTYTYDSRSQVTGDSTASYGYDNAGNRNNSGQTITTGNRLTSDATYNYTYDDEGNLVTKTSIALPATTTTYTWDVNNRLVSIDKYSVYNISYKYDVFGNRIEQVEDADGAGPGSSVTTRFAVEGSKVMQDAWGNRQSPVGTENWNVWADLNGSNALQVRYVRGDATDELFSRVKSDGTVASYLTDRMGSVRQLVDASGVVQDTIDYDGFGNILSESNNSFGDRWKWTRREFNSTTGLQYNRARYYRGESGRWLSMDPFSNRANDYNVTRYAHNQATSMIDPSGLVQVPGSLAQVPGQIPPPPWDQGGREGKPSDVMTVIKEIVKEREQPDWHLFHDYTTSISPIFGGGSVKIQDPSIMTTIPKNVRDAMNLLNGVVITEILPDIGFTYTHDLNRTYRLEFGATFVPSITPKHDHPQHIFSLRPDRWTVGDIDLIKFTFTLTW